MCGEVLFKIKVFAGFFFGRYLFFKLSIAIQPPIPNLYNYHSISIYLAFFLHSISFPISQNWKISFLPADFLKLVFHEMVFKSLLEIGL